MGPDGKPLPGQNQIKRTRNLDEIASDNEDDLEEMDKEEDEEQEYEYEDWIIKHFGWILYSQNGVPIKIIIIIIIYNNLNYLLKQNIIFNYKVNRLFSL